MIDEIPSWAKINLWLDENNALSLIYWQDDPEPYGANWWHRPNAETGWHMGGFQWRKPDDRPLGPTWDLQCLDPLTVSPSLLCHSCGAHGFIREGKWVSA